MFTLSFENQHMNRVLDVGTRCEEINLKSFENCNFVFFEILNLGVVEFASGRWTTQ